MQIIELTPIDTELFIQFRKYQDQFKVMLEDGLFEDFIGSAVIHKDGTGKIRITQKTITIQH